MSPRTTATSRVVRVRPGRRSFTLVEVVLASALATLTVAGAASVVAMLNRGDTNLRDRFDQTNSLAKAQLVFRRVFSSVVMSNDQKPRGYATAGTRAMSQSEQDAAARGAAEGFNLPTARFIVTPDERFIGGRIMPDGQGNPITPQRIEIVVSQPPLVSSLAPAEILEDRSLAQIVRGALETRPSITRSGKACWAVWWVPLVQTEQGWVPMTDSTGVTLGDKIMDGIRSIRWTVYDDRERKREYSAIWPDELPAYVNVEITTTSGMYAEWVFDVAWFIGPDSQNSTLPPEQRSGGTGSTGGAGGQGGTGGQGGAGGGGGGGGGRGTDTGRGAQRRNFGGNPNQPQPPTTNAPRPTPQTGGGGNRNDGGGR